MEDPGPDHTVAGTERHVTAALDASPGQHPGDSETLGMEFPIGDALITFDQGFPRGSCVAARARASLMLAGCRKHDQFREPSPLPFIGHGAGKSPSFPRLCRFFSFIIRKFLSKNKIAMSALIVNALPAKVSCFTAALIGTCGPTGLGLS